MNIFQNSDKEKNNLQMMVGDHQRITRFKRLRLIPSEFCLLGTYFISKTKNERDHLFIFSNRKSMRNNLMEVSKCPDTEA